MSQPPVGQIRGQRRLGKHFQHHRVMSSCGAMPLEKADWREKQIRDSFADLRPHCAHTIAFERAKFDSLRVERFMKPSLRTERSPGRSCTTFRS